MTPFDWTQCPKNFTPKQCREIAAERGVSELTIEGMRTRGWIGSSFIEKWQKQCICFPIGDDQGNVWRAHARSPERNPGTGKWDWTYEPETDPLKRPVPAMIWGNPGTAHTGYIVESQWEGSSLIDKLDLFPLLDAGEVCIIGTRGANFGNRLSAITWPGYLIAFPHDDQAGKGWLQNVLRATGGCYVVRSPAPHKDLGDWIKADAPVPADVEALINNAPLEEPAPQAASSNGTQHPTPDEIREKFKLITPIKLDKASRTLPPILIDKILYKGRRLLVTGAPKQRKTWLLHQIAYCIANGLPLFDKFSTAENPVFYVNFELMEATSALRFDAIGNKLGGNQANITILSVADYLDLIDDDFTEYLAIQATDLSTAAAFLDPMWRLLGSREENSNTEIGQVLKPLVKFSREAKASVIGAHHHAKGSGAGKEAIDRSSGAGAWQRDPATVIAVTAHKEKDAAIVDIITNDFPPIPKFVIRFEEPVFVLDPDLDPEDIKLPSKNGQESDPVIDRILTALQATDMDGGLSSDNLLQHIQVKGKDGKLTPVLRTLQRKLEVLIKKRKVVFFSIASGKYQLTPGYAAYRASFNSGNASI